MRVANAHAGRPITAAAELPRCTNAAAASVPMIQESNDRPVLLSLRNRVTELYANAVQLTPLQCADAQRLRNPEGLVPRSALVDSLPHPSMSFDPQAIAGKRALQCHRSSRATV